MTYPTTIGILAPVRQRGRSRARVATGVDPDVCAGSRRDSGPEAPGSNINPDAGDVADAYVRFCLSIV